MIESVTLISNGLVIVAIGALYRKVNKQEENSNKHIVNFTEKITERPDFNQMDSRIEKASKPNCIKISKLETDFRNHKHESKNGVVILGT